MKLLLSLWMAITQCFTGFSALFAPPAVPMEVVAHRGANQYAPENTLPAFEKAIALGAHGVETDVMETADGVIVLSHDETIERCSDGTGKVSKMTYAQLLEYDFGSWFSEAFAGTKIPTLAEFLNTVKDMQSIHIELKGPVTVSKVVAKVVDMGLLDKVVFSSFSMDYLEAARAVQPEAKLALIYGANTDTARAVAKDPAGFCKQHHLSALHGNVDSISSKIVRVCHENGIAVRPWTVNEKIKIAGCIGQNVDGIITDNVGLVQLQLQKSLIWQRIAALLNDFIAWTTTTF